MITSIQLHLDCCNHVTQRVNKVKESETEKGRDMKSFLGAFGVRSKMMQTGSSSDGGVVLDLVSEVWS